jgi:sugar O-acyltransferase (sialic acid O-acetyltransferase NeuD family)
MLIAGAGGHAIEILDILLEEIPKEQIAFFDDISDVQIIHNYFPVLKNELEVRKWFATYNGFSLGVGAVASRKILHQRLTSWGGKLVGVRSKTSVVSEFAVLDKTSDICKQVFVSSLAEVGLATLINTGAKIHHHAVVGNFCEISPGATLLGGVSVGDESAIGAGAIVLPKISICAHVIIGAGAIVTQSIAESGTYVGNPAWRIR